MNKTIAAALPVAAIGTLLFGCAAKHTVSSTAPPPVPPVQVVTVGRADLQQSVSVSGVLGPLPNKETTIVPQVSGTLTSLTVMLGSTVTSGQVLAQIAPQLPGAAVQQSKAILAQNEVAEQQAVANAVQQREQTRSAIQQAEAAVRNAEAALASDAAVQTGDEAAVKNADKDMNREQTLYTDGLVSEKDVEDSELAAQTAQSQLTAQEQTVAAQQQTVAAQVDQLYAAKSGTLQDLVKEKDIDVARQIVNNSAAALTASELQASLYTLRSPISGMITEIGANVGESVDNTTKLVTVSNLSKLQLTLNVPSGSIAEVRPGETVQISSDLLPAGDKFSGRVLFISPSFDSSSGTIPVIAELDNGSGLLKDDLTVTATITTAVHHHVLVVPRSAVLTDPDSGSLTVDTVGDDNVLHVKTVILGLSSGSDVEIRSGLSPGDRVAVSGQYGLTDGNQVSATPATGQVNTNGPE